MHDASDRLTFGPLQNPVRGLLHGSAAVLSVGLAGFLWLHPSCPPTARRALLNNGQQEPDFRVEPNWVHCTVRVRT